MRQSGVLEAVQLPPPILDGRISLESAMQLRRSIRSFTPEPLGVIDISQLLWAGQGITDPRGFRTVPSSGGLNPLEIYAVIGHVANILQGIYKYYPERHDMERVAEGDKRGALAQASLGQFCIQDGPVSFIIVAIPKRLAEQYGDQASRHVYLEAGHVAQNILLQAVSLHLGGVVIAAFREAAVREALSLPAEEEPIYIITVGEPQTKQ